MHEFIADFSSLKKLNHSSITHTNKQWLNGVSATDLSDTNGLPLLPVVLSVTRFTEDGSWRDMHFHLAFGVFYFFVMVASISVAVEESQFRSVKSDNGDVLCAVSPTNKTLSAVRSRIECASTCNKDCTSPCLAVNYWKKARLCQHFYYLSDSYAAQQDCANYEVTLCPALCF